jgi:surfeit locus 1 family protein
MRRFLFLLIMGAGGLAVLLSLGLWQVRRLHWKEAILAAIEAQIAAPPVALDSLPAPDRSRDLYRPVTVSGRTTGQEALVLSGRRGEGAGFEVISAFETASGRRILLDRGFVPEAGRDGPRPPAALTVTGNLHWPQESDRFTPPPDAAAGLWFARDVPALAAALGTEPVMVVARAVKGEEQGVVPVPVDASAIPNDHRQYAITWFSLAAVWAGMTVFFLWRIRRRGN